MVNMLVLRKYRLLRFVAICQKLKIYGTLTFLLTQDHMGKKFQNATPPTVFIQCQPTFMRTLATTVEYRLLLFLAIGQV